MQTIKDVANKTGLTRQAINKRLKLLGVSPSRYIGHIKVYDQMPAEVFYPANPGRKPKLK